MTMLWIDWMIVAILVLVVAAMAYYSKRLSQSVADFLAAGRCAGRYLLCVSENIAVLGAIVFISRFEMFYDGGFGTEWWGMMTIPVSLMIAVTGFVVYRYRQVRSLTLNQFFEIRYSRKLRLFCGMLAWISGMIQFGIYPAVTGRFFLYFCGIPEHFTIGGFEFASYPIVMFILLTIATCFALWGGMIAILVTDFLQGTFVNIALLIIFVILALKFDWSTITEALKTAPPGKSMLNPLDTSGMEKFNFFYFLIGAVRILYNQGSFQAMQGYSCSAKSPHELRMGKIISTFRWVVEGLIFVMIPLCAFTYMHHPQFSQGAAAVNEQLASLPNQYLQNQLRVSVAVSHLLPTGIMGLFAAVMMASFITTEDTYLVTWGSVFIQDVVMPLKKKPFTPRQHDIALKLSIIAVAVFVFIFSYFYRQTTEIFFFFALAGVIYLGGAGAVVIGGLYWSRGTTLGAWAAMLTGALCGIIGFTATHLNLLPNYLTGQVVFFITMLLSAGSYVLFSILKKEPPFNMDKMLHRGRYALQEDAVSAKPFATGFKALFSISDEFTRSDRFVYWLSMLWSWGWFIVFLIGTLAALIFNFSEDIWAAFWRWRIWFFFVAAVVVTIWIGYGGMKDLFYMFRYLKTAKRNDLDDGRVVDHHNLADDSFEEN